MAGISCVDFARRLRGLRARLHCWGDVPGSGAPTQNASSAFDLLSLAAADRSFRRNHAITLVGIWSLYSRFGQWVFCRRTIAVGANCLCDRSLGALRIDFARSSLALVRSQ